MQAVKKLFSAREAKPASSHPLALFYYCDTAVTHQMQQLNHLMRTSPDNLDRRAKLIAQLKEAQHNMINLLRHITEQLVPAEDRDTLDFRAKYPENVRVDQINGPVWFGAECLTAGSHIANHEQESDELRPAAVKLCHSIKEVRDALRKECLTTHPHFSHKLMQLLKSFDSRWAQFEFSYVSLMCKVKTKLQHYQQQEVAVLFSETTHRALEKGYLTMDMIEMMDPSVMFAIPRLAIVCGLVVCPEGPLNPDRSLKEIPHCFRGYRTLLMRIKELLSHLSEKDLTILERALCSAQGLGSLKNSSMRGNATASHKLPRKKKGSLPRRGSIPIRAPLSRRGSFSRRSSLFETHTATDSRLPLTGQSLISSLQAPKQKVEKKMQSLEQLLSGYTISAPTPGDNPSEETPASCSSTSSQQKCKHQLKCGPVGFSSMNDLLHRLFVTISGVADKLQSNYAEDMRIILKYVFELVLSEPSQEEEEEGEEEEEVEEEEEEEERVPLHSNSQPSLLIPQGFDLSMTGLVMTETVPSSRSTSRNCSFCQRAFSMTLRRHHCKFCGKVVCVHCSPHSLPTGKSRRSLRTCNGCFLKELSTVTHAVSNSPPFTMHIFS